MRPDKKRWLKDAKHRLIATILCAIVAVISAGYLFDWRAAAGVLIPAVAVCVVYSLREKWKLKKGDEK